MHDTLIDYTHYRALYFVKSMWQFDFSLCPILISLFFFFFCHRCYSLINIFDPDLYLNVDFWMAQLLILIQPFNFSLFIQTQPTLYNSAWLWQRTYKQYRGESLYPAASGTAQTLVSQIPGYRHLSQRVNFCFSPRFPVTLLYWSPKF